VGAVGVALLGDPGDGGPQVRSLDLDQIRPAVLLEALEQRFCVFGEREVERRVPVPQRPLLPGRNETLARVLPDRLEQPVAFVREAEQALLGERLQGVEVRSGDFLCRL
jgi:hypothetical protein